MGYAQVTVSNWLGVVDSAHQKSRLRMADQRVVEVDPLDGCVGARRAETDGGVLGGAR
jgi:hypothetical protein